MRKKHLALIIGLIFAGIGFMLPYWPFVLLGLLCCALMYPFLAIVLGALADVVFGLPGGLLKSIYFPFTLFGFAAALFSLFASSRLRSRNLY